MPPATARDRQISVRIASETDAWLEIRAGSSKNKAGFIRQIIERERTRERELELLEMFNKAALDVTEEDIAERESLLGGFAGGSGE
jgi:aldehyde:ferredoxin oxidoreductase